MSGFNLPPGVSMRDIDPPESPCECCGLMSDSCICPECPVCGTCGDPQCYAAADNVNEMTGDREPGHGLEYNKTQLIGQAKMRIAHFKELIQDDEQYIAWLEDETPH